MIKTISWLMPGPVKNIVLASVADEEDRVPAANRLIRSSIRVAIAALGIISAWKLLGTFGYSDLGFAASLIPQTLVYAASMPAGTIMQGSMILALGVLFSIEALGLEILTLSSLFFSLFSFRNRSWNDSCGVGLY